MSLFPRCTRLAWLGSVGSVIRCIAWGSRAAHGVHRDRADLCTGKPAASDKRYGGMEAVACTALYKHTCCATATTVLPFIYSLDVCPL